MFNSTKLQSVWSRGSVWLRFESFWRSNTDRGKWRLQKGSRFDNSFLRALDWASRVLLGHSLWAIERLRLKFKVFTSLNFVEFFKVLYKVLVVNSESIGNFHFNEVWKLAKLNSLIFWKITNFFKLLKRFYLENLRSAHRNEYRPIFTCFVRRALLSRRDSITALSSRFRCHLSRLWNLTAQLTRLKSFG